MAVTHLELTRQAYAGGRAFGDAGACEELRGTATFALDPAHPRNAAITDLDLAPRGEDGCVHLSADVSILRPVDPARVNRRLFLDVVNRGNPIMMRLTDTSPIGGESDGWLLQRGYTVVRCGWQHDVPPGDGRFTIDVPEALEGGRPITGRIASLHQLDAPAQVIELSNRGHTPYPAADLEEPTAVLSERDYLGDEPRIVPRDRWRFARLEAGEVVPDARHIYRADGFLPGKVYEVIYTAVGAPLTGAGLAATRDLVSFLRFGSAEQGNPCAGQIDYALAAGASQTGRFLRQMVYLGFCEDEEERLVFDGLLPHIAGGRLIEANWRFGQPSYVGPLSLANQFPYTDETYVDPVSGRADGLQQTARERGKQPKVMHVNTSCEYWGSQAALIHLTPDCGTDAAVPDNVRIYLLAGTQHMGAGLPLSRVEPTIVNGAYHLNTIDYRPLLRALVVALDAWATEGKEPPPSQYPRHDDGTLAERENLRKKLAGLPGPGLPPHLPPVWRVDFGPDAEKLHRAVRLPPSVVRSLGCYVADVDDDGNEVAGIRHPDVAVPLATYTGWNPRHPQIGGDDQLLRTQGATIPFAATRAQREAIHDPRPSIAERYPSREAFLAQVETAAQELVSRGFLLAEDVGGVVDYSGRRYDELAVG